MNVFTVLRMESMKLIVQTSADDVRVYAGMHNIDKGHACLVNCPVCPVTDGTEPKMRPGRFLYRLVS